MPFYLHNLLDQFAIIPLVVVLWLIKYSSKRIFYKPFIILLIIKEITQIVSLIMVNKYHLSNAIPFNIYYFFEAILFAIQYWQWSNYRKKNQLFSYILIFFILAWIIDTFIFNSLTTYNFYFRITYCSILALFAIYQINYITVSYRKPMINNAIAIISAALLLLFTLNLIYEVSFKIGYIENKYVHSSMIISRIMDFVDAFVNILFAWAVYNLPTKKDFSIPKHEEKE